ncbi:LOW QUALITY PROTEIN: growth-regulated alpha protein-like [Trichosurus vulpecula]|uniref:LOW QUALITY PROTEIN: growth-regulated alpha protein-like n=1 Tax=Trichosurus vulpecula TaxID=9337 RepID=UPI00186B05AF|nr:LOW QUALITY PROTEIN: growth-regulated alpha protein-like [Trichosurus vulpecula]
MAQGTGNFPDTSTKESWNSDLTLYSCELQAPNSSIMSRSLRQISCLFLLCLLSGLLTPSVRLASGAPVTNELRCQCLQTVQGISYKSIANLKVIPAGPHCANLEVIATLKNGNELCLNPAAPQIKKVVEKVLKSSN